MQDLSLIILNYKQKGLVKQCVKGILAARPQFNYEIIVVDNNSGDNCLSEIKQIFDKSLLSDGSNLLNSQNVFKPELVLVQSQTNDGFAVGNNLGIKKAKGNFVAILNPDIAVVAGALEKMVEFMKKNSDAGIIGPRLINPDGSIQESCRKFPDWKMPLYRRSFLGKLPWGKKALGKYLMADFSHHQTITTDWLFGAFLLVKKSVFEKIGLFDESFFMYFEDLDLCRRCWQVGFKVYYYAEVEMVHYHNRLSAERTGLLALMTKAGRIHLLSGLKYFVKYFGKSLPNR